MNSVPYIFCDAVATLLEDLDHAKEFVESAFTQPGKWKAALNDHVTNRRKISLQIGLTTKYSYSLVDETVTGFCLVCFADVQQIAPKFLKMSGIAVFPSSVHRPCAVEEFDRVIRFIAPFMIGSRLEFYKYIEASDDHFARILAPLERIPLRTVLGLDYGCVEEFESKQMKLGYWHDQ